MDPISMAAESFSVHGPGGVRIAAERHRNHQARRIAHVVTQTATTAPETNGPPPDPDDDPPPF
ncbi:hypothetical protein ABLN97_18030 [Mycobacterium tuberculosis]